MNYPRYLILALTMLTGGCLKLEETFTIRPDGSASLDLIYAISEQAVMQMKAVLKVRDQLAYLSGEEPAAADPWSGLFLNPVEDQLRRELKKYEKLGIVVDRLKVEARDNWRHVQLKVTCKSLADLARTDFFPEYGFSLSKDADGAYVFFRDRENRDGASSGSIPDPETLKLMTPVLGGFNTVFKVNTPGRITKSNAHAKSLYGAAWEFSYDKDPNAVTRLQDQQFKITFEGKGSDGKSLNLPAVSQRRAAAPKAK